MAITAFNGSNLDDVKAAIDTSLNDIANRFGIELKIEKQSYDRGGHYFHAKLIGNTVKGGVIQTRERIDFTRYAKSLHGLDPDWLDTSFTAKGKTFKIVGLKTSSPTYNVLAEGPNGICVFTSGTIKYHMQNKLAEELIEEMFDIEEDI